MPVKSKSRGNPSVKAKAKELLAFAYEHLREGQSAPELFIVIFGPHGKARMTFPTKKEWAAFQQSEEIKEIERLIETFDRSPSPSAGDPTANGHPSVTLRLPRSIHQSLVAEAAEEGVSLDQLCLSKLVAQLRELV